MEQLKELFYYENGKIYNKVTRCSTAQKDKEAGYLRKDGYRGILVNRKEWLTHRVVYFLHHGYIPERLDHIDRNPANNKIENLREASNIDNCANSGPRKNNKTGYKGVSQQLSSNGYIVTCGGKYFGTFINIKEAAMAYNYAAFNKYGEFAYLNKV